MRRWSGERAKCKSCDGIYDGDSAGTCRQCYEKANKTEKELKREIEDLKAKVIFLRLGSTHHPASFSDVVLIASDDSSAQPHAPVPAHKAVLVSRSPVFRAMLEIHEMEESLSGTVKIGDVSSDALRAFVNYLYTAETCLDQQLACDLLILAEKYQVQHLKDYCQKFLVSKLNWDNSFLMYTFAHRHNAKHIVHAALTLITNNMNKLTAREEYAELVKEDPRLVVEIYETYLSRFTNYDSD